ncbi:MAG: 50S ribosomal protein L15 [Limisphaerales bacterium]
MRLHTLKPRAGAKHRRKRLGSGEASGTGKTSGRGHKGQRSRAGKGIRPGFEGGQMPLYRRLPKRGFSNAEHTTIYHPVNLETLNNFETGTTVDAEAIKAAGLANGKANGGIKILARGKIEKKLTVKANAFSKAAKEAIEAAGGTCEVVSRKPVAAEAAPAEEKKD